MHAPMTIYVAPEYRSLSWAARLMPDDPTQKGFNGQIRLATDTTQMHANTSAGVSGQGNAVIDFSKLGALDEYGGWVVRGEATVITSGIGGHFGLGLYGEGAGLRIVWAAVSLSP